MRHYFAPAVLLLILLYAAEACRCRHATLRFDARVMLRLRQRHATRRHFRYGAITPRR